MVIYPAAIFFFLIWCVIVLRDADRAVILVIATLPFGMFAFLDAGGLSLLVAHCLASLTLAAYALRRVGGSVAAMTVPNQGLWILGFAAYALVSATILVRLFEGAIMVFPMSVEFDGLRVSTIFYSSMKPLAPSNSNIAQSAYILLSALIFVVFLDIVRRRGTNLVERGLVWAAFLNIALATFDMLGADQVLSFVRTADYSLANQQTVFGLPRVIGGYAEASVFGPATAVLFGYFATSYLAGGRTRDGFLAIANLLFALLSYSTTGFVALFVAIFLIALQLRGRFGGRLPVAFAHWLVIAIAAVFLILCIVGMTTSFFQTAAGILYEQILAKQTSVSGLERAAWARAGFQAMLDTWGLGAGAGSLRANGFAAVLLGSVGIPGTVLFICFIWSAFFARGAVSTPDQGRVLAAARVAGLTFLTGKLVSGTTPDPELMLIILAVLATAARFPAWARQPVRAHVRSRSARRSEQY